LPPRGVQNRAQMAPKSLLEASWRPRAPEKRAKSAPRGPRGTKKPPRERQEQPKSDSRAIFTRKINLAIMEREARSERELQARQERQEQREQQEERESQSASTRSSKASTARAARASKQQACTIAWGPCCAASPGGRSWERFARVGALLGRYAPSPADSGRIASRSSSKG